MVDHHTWYSNTLGVSDSPIVTSYHSTWYSNTLLKSIIPPGSSSNIKTLHKQHLSIPFLELNQYNNPVRARFQNTKKYPLSEKSEVEAHKYTWVPSWHSSKETNKTSVTNPTSHSSEGIILNDSYSNSLTTVTFPYSIGLSETFLTKSNTKKSPKRETNNTNILILE